MNTLMGYQKPMPEWARCCSVCGAAPNHSCITLSSVKLESNHGEHELLGWEAKYDAKYRELALRERFGKTFERQYRRRKVA